jgi:ribonucleoside-triphosphate reductase (formate)
MARKAICGNCKSENVYGMSRVVGYYSIIENWNESKLAELKDRQKGAYKIEEETIIGETAKMPSEEMAVVR